MIGRFLTLPLLLFFPLSIQQQYSCIEGIYFPASGAQCSLRVEFVSITPNCEISNFQLSHKFEKHLGFTEEKEEKILYDIDSIIEKWDRDKRDSEEATESPMATTTVENETRSFNDSQSTPGAISEIRNAFSSETELVSDFTIPSQETTDNITSQVSITTENATKITAIPPTGTLISSHVTQKITESETTKSLQTEHLQMDAQSENKTRLVGANNPSVPVVFTCSTDFCNKNISFTEVQRDDFFDQLKYTCIEKHIGQLEKALKSFFQNATKIKEANVSSELFEAERIESTIPLTTTEKYEPPPDKHVPEGIPLNIVFVVSFVVLGILAVIREIRRMRKIRH